MIVTSVIVGIFLIPYMLIILTGHLLMKSNKIRKYVQPIYEAIHAPYKYNKQYYFTARQRLLIFGCILYAQYRGNSFFLVFSIFLPVYFIFMTFQAYLRPFKSKVLNILNLSVMINFGLILCTNWYFLMEDYHGIVRVFNAIFVHVLIFTLFVVEFFI